MIALLRVAYDGTDFAGCPESPGRRTVVGEIRAALGRLGVGGVVETLSRTDAGVHALGQVVVLVVDRAWPAEAFVRYLGRHLPPDLRPVAGAVVQAPPKVLRKAYRYTVDASETGDPFLARTAWRDRVALADLVPLAGPLVGTHDFRAFRRRGETRESLVRTVTRAGWTADGTRLFFRIEGEGFPYRLVRSLVGAQLAVARGACDRQDYLAALEGHVTRAAVQQAPARGLLLERIDLDPEPAWFQPS